MRSVIKSGFNKPHNREYSDVLLIHNGGLVIEIDVNIEKSIPYYIKSNSMCVICNILVGYISINNTRAGHVQLLLIDI